MDKSECITDLAAALVKAQGAIKGAKKDSTNPHFRNSYADLESVWDACREPLTKNGLSVTQMPHTVTDEQGRVHLYVRTMLLHSSGQFIADTCEIPLSKLDAQGVGSAITYGRRYGLSAMVGVAPADDDGEAAVGRGNASRNAQDAPQSLEPPKVIVGPQGAVPVLPLTEPPSPAKAALQPVIHAADVLNGWLEEIAKEHGRDIKDVRKYAKQYMKMEFPQDDVKTMTPERASVIAMRLVEIFRKDAAEQKELG